MIIISDNPFNLANSAKRNLNSNKDKVAQCLQDVQEPLPETF